MKKALIFVLVIVESCSLFLLYKSSINKKNEPVVLDDVVYKEKQTNFIYLLEQNIGEEDYLESPSKEWPSKEYGFNIDKSFCLNEFNEKIDNALTYDNINDLIILNDEFASVCNLYFNKKETTIE